MKKYIGVCTTRINDEFSRNFIDLLHKAVEPSEYAVAVFHSVFDFYDHEVEYAARSIFGMLPYSELCAVVILHDALYDSNILDMIISGARENNVPVIMARNRDERCYSIVASFELAYSLLLNSVIRDQHITDVFYLAGRDHDDPDSEHRIAIYKRVLEENGLDFDPSRVEYGGYWEEPAARAVKRIFDKNGKAPEAILCANDIMAYTVMEKLAEKGLRIPEDVIVTGFDGLESSKYCSPSLSTCREDTPWLADLVYLTVKKLDSGESVPDVDYYPYNAEIRQSSSRTRKVRTEDQSSKLFYLMRADEINERRYNEWLDQIIAAPDIASLRRNMPGMAKNGYSVAVRADSFSGNAQGNGAGIPSEYIIIRDSGDGNVTEGTVTAAELTGSLIKNIPEGQIGLFSMISNKSLVYGLAFTPSADIQNDAQKINRYVKTLNRALYVSLCGEKRGSCASGG